MATIFYNGKNLRIENLDHGVKKMIFTRPEIHNAFHQEMISEVTETLNSLSEIKNVSDMRLLIISGEGKSFCAGADLSYMLEQSQKSEVENYSDAQNLGKMFYKLASFPTPVVCSVQGAVIGGGVGLVCCADFVLAEENTLFSTSEVLLGIIPAVISPYILRKVSLAKASEMMLTGKRMNATESLSFGLVNKLTTVNHTESDLIKVTRDFLKAGPNAARRAKELILKFSPLPSQDEFDFSVQQIANIRTTSEAKEGLNAFFEKKPSQWATGQ